MRDIREVGLDKRDIVKQMLDEFFQNLDEKKRPKQNVIDQMLDYWSKKDVIILGKFDEQNLLAIAVLGLISNRISIICVRTSQINLDKQKIFALERELFDTSFEHLKMLRPWVVTVAGWLNTSLIEHAIEVGFKRFENIGMAVDRESLEAVPVPEVPSQYTLELYDNQWKNEIAMLLYESFKDSDSAHAEPNELYTLERCFWLVNDIASGGAGNFKNGSYSWVLKHGNEIIGVTLRTLLSETEGLGAAMCLKPLYRRKGLGKLLFVHSLKYMLEKEPKVNKIHLYVMETNPARRLYASVGFNETSRFPIYTWLKDDDA